MSANNSKSTDSESLSSSAQKNETSVSEIPTLKPIATSQTIQSDAPPQTLTNPDLHDLEKTVPSTNFSNESENSDAEPFTFGNEINAVSYPNYQDAPLKSSYSKPYRQGKKEKRIAKDNKLLNSDKWLVRNGHTFTFIGLYLFSILVLFRPYELIPALGFLSATAFYFAIATLLIYLPTQFAAEGNLSILTTEVKAVLAMTLIALFTIPIAKSPETAWSQFNDPYIKAVLIFIVMINVIRTRRRLTQMMWLSLSIGFVLSYLALGMYMRGEMNIEDYRVSVKIGGIFENPNEMSIHLIMMIPLAITLGLASKKLTAKIIYFLGAVVMLSANMITYSRGGFLGLIISSAFLVWKLGRGRRIIVMTISGIIGLFVVLLAPGNFGLRILSIFIPGLDPVGSSNQRSELLKRSILVSLRNPWGIGIGNFPIVGVQNLVSHNAYTQVSSELGVLGLIAYLVFIISPFRKLAAIERKQLEKEERDWFYYLSIGLQSSLIAYMVSSFFASIAYNWFIYYLVAYIVAFRRIYQIEKDSIEKSGKTARKKLGESKDCVRDD